MGDQGAGKMQDMFLALLDEYVRKPEQLSHAMDKLLSEEALKWCRLSVRNELLVAKDMTERMLAKESVMGAQCQTTTWLTTVLKTLERYICFEPVGAQPGAGSSSDGAAVLRGHEALQKRYDEMMTMKERKMDMLLPFQVWKHLLSQQQQEQILQWRSELLKQGGVIAKPQRVESKKAPKKNKKTVASAEDVDAAALALLGLRSA